MLDAQTEGEFDVLDGLPPELNAALKEELRYRVMQQAIIAGAEQRQAMAELDADPMCHSEHGTQRVMIHPFFVAYWNDRFPGCWEDPDFVNEFIRDNECVRVKCQSRKTMVSFAGMDVKTLTAAASGLGPSDSKLFGSRDVVVCGGSPKPNSPKPSTPLPDTIPKSEVAA